MRNREIDEVEEMCRNHDEAYDPDPLTLLLEIANLVIQPGSLSAIAAGISAATGVLMWRDIKEKQVTEIRRKLYEIDRALTDGFASLMVLASLLDQFNHLEKPIRVGGAAIMGYKNAQRLRKAHEDCRSAVKDARDAFSDLSALLPHQARDDVSQTLEELNKISGRIICVGESYARFLVAASQALSSVDSLICRIGTFCDYKRSGRIFTQDLVQSIPRLRDHD